MLRRVAEALHACNRQWRNRRIDNGRRRATRSHLHLAVGRFGHFQPVRDGKFAAARREPYYSDFVTNAEPGLHGLPGRDRRSIQQSQAMRYTRPASRDCLRRHHANSTSVQPSKFEISFQRLPGERPPFQARSSSSAASRRTGCGLKRYMNSSEDGARFHKGGISAGTTMIRGAADAGSAAGRQAGEAQEEAAGRERARDR